MSDDVKRISPITGLFSTIEMMRDQSLTMIRRQLDGVLRDDWDQIIVDTCHAPDTGEWETGVSQHGGNSSSWVIVEQYCDRDAAVAGHAKWVESLRADPTQTLTDIDVWGLEDHD